MADPRSATPRIPIFLLVFLLLIAAVVGGVVAKVVPLGSSSGEQPRALAAPSRDSLSPLVKRTAPAVVNIATLQPSPAEQNPLLQDPFYRRYFGIPDAALQPTIAAGSGVIVDGKRGLVITNFHVVRDAEQVEVGLKDGRKLPADPVVLAPELDIAVLRIDAKDLPTLALGDSGKLEVGDYVVAIGNPFGLGQTVTSGIISATDRPLGHGDSRRFLQTDAPINPGNSGGPLIDLNGEVIGINSALFSPSQNEMSAGSVGIGFAIPSNDVKRILAQAEQRAAHQ
ncbi:MAG TPA: trypsin-like peptidase domain-containing protein [Sphingomicrobium sp.]|jgi:S1-C subfamily serine protease|nr:trypsin-like peptidase domain-containing protein [Sphingomicrobium sp.]